MPSASRPSRISGTSGIPGPKQMKKKAAWRVLVALLVYNGEEFVGPCLSSLSRLDPGPHSVDVLVLDDASPSPGWSDRCREMAVGMGMGYYRTPRNLGIPRNMNLGMFRALHAEYDAVILLNSDTVVPRNLIPTLIRPLSDDPMLSSTTAWSNNVSIYSLPNSDPERLASQPGLVDWLSEMLDKEFAGQAIPIPSAVGFCMALPTSAIAEVGLMDPVFGRGYSEEIDWSSPQPRAGLPLCHGSLVLRVPRWKRNHESRRADRGGRSHRSCASSDYRRTLSAVRRTAEGHHRIEHSRRHARTRPTARPHRGGSPARIQA